MAVTVRQATREDIPTIADFNCRMAHESEGMDLNPETTLRGTTAVFDRPHLGSYYVAEAEGRVVASMMVTPEHSDWRCSTYWWIQSVFVVPEFRRQKVFSTMYEYVKAKGEELRRQDPSLYAGIRLYVDVHNERARRTYEAIGLKESHYQFYECLVDQ